MIRISWRPLIQFLALFERCGNMIAPAILYPPFMLRYQLYLSGNMYTWKYSLKFELAYNTVIIVTLLYIIFLIYSSLLLSYSPISEFYEPTLHIILTSIPTAWLSLHVVQIFTAFRLF